MTNRPAPKSMTLVTSCDIESREIRFYADKYAVGDMEEFGVLLSPFGDGYVLRVDPRYDFNEVLNYIRTYGKPKESPQRETRYDWSDAPEWVRFIATDKDGEVWAYQNKPFRERLSWHPDGGDCWLVSNLPSYCEQSDWKDSLEERPQ